MKRFYSWIPFNLPPSPLPISCLLLDEGVGSRKVYNSSESKPNQLQPQTKATLKFTQMKEILPLIERGYISNSDECVRF